MICRNFPIRKTVEPMNWFPLCRLASWFMQAGGQTIQTCRVEISPNKQSVNNRIFGIYLVENPAGQAQSLLRTSSQGSLTGKVESIAKPGCSRNKFSVSA
jgi:hypothetical protein